MHAPPSIPSSTTWEKLQNSRNEAAIATLATGLNSADVDVRHACIKALVNRKEPRARRELILHWNQLDELDLEFVRGESARFVEAALGLLSNGSLSEKRQALIVIDALDLCDAAEKLIQLVLDSRNALREQATQCLTDMCRRKGQAARAGHDAPSVRGKLLEPLNYQLAVFHEHRNLNLVDAWLCLVHWDDSAQRGLIADPRHAAYRSVLSRLGDSQDPAVLQLLGGYLLRQTTPTSVIDVIAERTDPELARQTAGLLNDSNTSPFLRRLRKTRSLNCLRGLEPPSLDVADDIERRLWLMIAASTDDLGQVLRGAFQLEATGTLDAQQIAAEMLRVCKRPDLETLVAAIQSATADADNHDQTGNLIQQLLTWLASESIPMKRAAAGFFGEFTLTNLLQRTRQWPTQMCKAMAGIVSAMEPDASDTLSRELRNPAVKRRLAALQVTQLLDVAEQVSSQLIPLLEDPRLEVRVQVIDLLSALGHESLEEMIPKLLSDASTDIQDAANRAVRRLNRKSTTH